MSEAQNAEIPQERFRQSALGHLAELENRAAITGNTLYVWLAICKAHLHGLPLPDWCLKQLFFWAVEMHMLAARLDPTRGFTRREDGESEQDFTARFLARYERPEVTPAEAVRLARSTFGLSGQGSNAFARFLSDEQKILEFKVSEATKHAPPAIRGRRRKNQRNGDARESRRRIADGKALSRGKPRT